MCKQGRAIQLHLCDFLEELFFVNNWHPNDVLGHVAGLVRRVEHINDHLLTHDELFVNH